MRARTSETVAGGEKGAQSIARALRDSLDSALASVDALDQALHNAREHVNAREIYQTRANVSACPDDPPKQNRPSPRRSFDPGFTADPRLAEALLRAQQNNPALERARDRELASILSRAETGDLRRNLHRAHALIGDLHRDLDHVNILDHERTRDLARGIGGAQNCIRDLSNVLHRAIAIERDRLRAPISDLERGRTRTHGLYYANDLVGKLDRALRAVLEQVGDLRRSLNRPSAIAGCEQRPRRISQPALRLAGAATGILPRRSRQRYAEEWRCELGDLAAAGAGGWRQLQYAARQLVRTVSLRFALTDRSRHRGSAQ